MARNGGFRSTTTAFRSNSSRWRARRPVSRGATILRKREAYRKAFAGLDPRKVARFDAARIEKLMQDAGIVRDRLKIESTVANARAVLAVQLDAYLWRFVGGRPIRKARRRLRDIQLTTPESDAMSKELKKRGFVDSTICYALMQACGLADDHLRGCFRASPG
jgi:DNA-3-methyladenine glycosylase I